MVMVVAGGGGDSGDTPVEVPVLLFHTLGCNPRPYYFVLNDLSFIHETSFYLASVSLECIIIFVGLYFLCLVLFGFGFVLPNSLPLQNVPHSFCLILESSLVLTSGISQKSPGLLHWTAELETMISVLSTIIATEILLLLGRFS